MNLKEFKAKYPSLFWRDENLTREEILTNIIQLENKKALKDYIKKNGFDQTKSDFFCIRKFFETNPSMKLRYQKMYNRFIYYKKKSLWIIKDMRKYKFWWTKRI